jgi:DNA (cytosine-5-)-methyltransferase|nr:MAG TPA: Cytosine specific methyltransferase [Bacteriophage sp.]
MTYLSVCSGIEAASVAWGPLGWQAVGFSEIEKFPCAVLEQRFPGVKNFGDMIRFREWENVGQFRVLVGGTPCQSFSVAGLRQGLNDSRGSLMLAYCALASYYKPRWVVWENVPGVLSSNGGRDFGTFLALLAQCGYGFAYRVFDARYFGVPQRRRRVYVVGCLGNWRCAAAVLFDSVGMQRYIAPGKTAGEEAAGKVEESAGNAMYLTRQNNSTYKQSNNTADTVIARYGTGGGNVPLVYTESSFAQYRKGVGTLSATGGALSGGSENLVLYKRALRRLTPLECERLQGFPDNWTRISWRGKPPEQCPDGPRYKAIGNSMAIPVMRWIGERIQLFDCYYIERKRKYVDYEHLYELLKKSPVSFEQIRRETGLDKKGAYQVITTLSLKYPVYSPERGMYALLKL